MAKKLTLEQVIAAIENEEFAGFCVACGEQADGCEPDARNYKCESCGKNAVFGAEEILLRYA